ncbi:MAG: exodeoxyribonuclease III [Verrucomicrobiota bacterium]
MASSTIRLSSWNVNGFRASLEKGLRDYVTQETPDVLCLQEVKARAEDVDETWLIELGYESIWNSAQKKGYSGTAIFHRTDQEVESPILGMGIEEHDAEGRLITLSFPTFHLVTVYTPNSQRGLARLDYRLRWDEAFLSYLKGLESTKPVIFCGDLNCAHEERDLANPKQNRKNAGFTDEERASLTHIMNEGFVDTFRLFETAGGHYSWWTYRSNARERNIGWRLDYFLVSEALSPSIESSIIRPDVLGSDHCPVELTLRLPETI